MIAEQGTEVADGRDDAEADVVVRMTSDDSKALLACIAQRQLALASVPPGLRPDGLTERLEMLLTRVALASFDAFYRPPLRDRPDPATALPAQLLAGSGR